MKNRTHGLSKKEMELVQLLMSDCHTTGDIQAKLKRLFAGTIEQMLEAEMEDHLGYEKNDVAGNNSGNSRNGYGKNTITSEYGECEISVPRDRNGEFEPKLMKLLGLKGKQRKNDKYHSYKGEVGKVADNLLKRDFKAKKPFEKLTTDVTQFKVGDTKVYLSPVMDLFNREIVSYSISLSPNLEQIREMLNGLFDKLPDDATPLFHSDQGWQYQHAEYQRLLAEHNITQSMSRKGNCMDNGAMENFFGRLKVEMFYGEKFESVDA